MARRNVAARGTILSFNGKVSHVLSFSWDDTGNEIEANRHDSLIEEVLADIGTVNVEWEVLGTRPTKRGDIGTLQITLPTGKTIGPYTSMVCVKNRGAGA